MQSETKYTKQDLETMRAWSLQRKIQVTQTRIIEWIGRYDWNVYISFSGGKDSTVLADLTARAYQAFWCPNRKEPLHLVFVNTGLEYPEIQKFVKYFAKWLERKYEIPVDLKVLTPELTFPEVLTKYGYPVIGKEVAKVIYYARHGSQWALNRLDGLDKRGKPSRSIARMWFLPMRTKSGKWTTRRWRWLSCVHMTAINAPAPATRKPA